MSRCFYAPASASDTSFLARLGFIRGLVCGDFRVAVFAEVVFSATGFSWASLDRVRWPFALTGEVFLLGALGSVSLEVAAAGADPLAATCAARASFRWRFLRWSLFSLGAIALSFSLSPRFILPYDSVTSIMRSGDQSFSSRSIAQASTAILRASAIAAFFLRVFCLPQIRS